MWLVRQEGFYQVIIIIVVVVILISIYLCVCESFRYIPWVGVFSFDFFYLFISFLMSEKKRRNVMNEPRN